MNITLTSEQLRQVLNEVLDARLEPLIEQIKPLQKTYNKKEACEALNISRNTLNARIKEGKIQCKNGLITHAELVRFSSQS